MDALEPDQLIEKLRSLKTDLQRRGIEHVDLFGSRARGDNRPGSDVDLLVDLSPDEQLSLLDIIGIGHTVEDYIGLPTSIVLRRSAPQQFLARTAPDLLSIF